jgi:hypothetical protein
MTSTIESATTTMIPPIPLSCALLCQLVDRAMSYAAAQGLQVVDRPSLGRFRLPDAAAATVTPQC